MSASARLWSLPHRAPSAERPATRPADCDRGGKTSLGSDGHTSADTAPPRAEATSRYGSRLPRFQIEMVALPAWMRPLELATQALVGADARRPPGPVSTQACLSREDAVLVLADDGGERWFLVVEADDRVYLAGGALIGMCAWAARRFRCCPWGRVACPDHAEAGSDPSRLETRCIPCVRMTGAWRQARHLKIKPV